MKKFAAFLIGGIAIISLAGCSYSNQWTTQPVVQPMQIQPPPSLPTQATPTSDNNSQNIVIKNFKFEPSSITIKAGTTVTWTNQDKAPHTIVSDDQTFNGNTDSNGTFSYTFKKSGTYNYYCSIHPSMIGTIIVQ